MEDKDYSHLVTLLNDVITLWQISNRMDIHNSEQPDSIPKTLQKTERPPKQEVIDAHIRAEQLIDLIHNCDYWERIDVMTIIVMSIIDMVNKKSHQYLHYADCFDAKYNI